MNEVLRAIKNRRSVRRYAPEQLKKEHLEAILEAGIYAPSAHNEQPWHFTVIQNPELIALINQKSKQSMAKAADGWVRDRGRDPGFMLTYHAPTLIIVSGRKDGIAWETDCAAAIENMLIAAESLGVGSVWLGLVRFFFRHPQEVARLNIPEGYEPFYGVALGYKAEDTRAPAPERRRDVVNYIL